MERRSSKTVLAFSQDVSQFNPSSKATHKNTQIKDYLDVLTVYAWPIILLYIILSVVWTLLTQTSVESRLASTVYGVGHLLYVAYMLATLAYIIYMLYAREHEFKRVSLVFALAIYVFALTATLSLVVALHSLDSTVGHDWFFVGIGDRPGYRSLANCVYYLGALALFMIYGDVYPQALGIRLIVTALAFSFHLFNVFVFAKTFATLLDRESKDPTVPIVLTTGK